jgi:hypothetical protein
MLLVVTAVASVGLGPTLPRAPAPRLAESATVVVSPAGSAVPISPEFWGLNVEVDHRFNLTDGALVNATPVTYLRFPGGAYADRYNYTKNVLWNLNGSQTKVGANISEFVSTCEAIHCHSILQLPAEINSSSTAADYVYYVEHNLSYTPDYWEIGNEPARWTHFNVPWANWSNVSGGNVTPMQYAHVLHDYIAAIRAVDPTTPIMAPSSGQEPNYARAWIDAVLQVNGASVGAISVHSYAAGNGPTEPTLNGFFENLEGTWSLPNVIQADRSYITASCPNCTQTKLFVDEINSAYNTGSYAPYLGSFNGTLFLAAEVTQGLNQHADSLDWFCLDSSYQGSWETAPGHLQSQYYLFSDLLVHLENETLPISVAGPTGLYSAATTNGTENALLFVNTNVTTPVTLNLSGLSFSSGSSLTQYLWTNATAQPVQSSTNASTNLTMPPLSVLVLAGPASRSTPPTYLVQFDERSLASGAEWTANLSGFVNSSGTSTIDFWLPNGTYSYGITPPIGYLASPPTGPLVVNGTGQEVPLRMDPFATGGAAISEMYAQYEGRIDLQNSFPALSTNYTSFTALASWAAGIVGGQAKDRAYPVLAPFGPWYELMGTYNDRRDLQMAFPMAYTNVTHYKQLVNWADGVVSGHWSDPAYRTLAPFASWYVLMGTYDGRSDLQAAFPEAYGNLTSYTELITWADGVVQGRWSDSANSTLAPFASWYRLMGTYNARQDLQSAFPDVYGNFTEYTNLVNWASGVVAGHWVDPANSTLAPVGYLFDLMSIYEGRSDLRSAFPDAFTNWTKGQALLSWAGAVVNGTFSDGSRAKLLPYGYWYVLFGWVYEHRADLERAFPFALTQETTQERLLAWAKSVVLLDFPDPAYSTLLPYAVDYVTLG